MPHYVENANRCVFEPDSGSDANVGDCVPVAMPAPKPPPKPVTVADFYKDNTVTIP